MGAFKGSASLNPILLYFDGIDKGPYPSHNLLSHLSAPPDEMKFGWQVMKREEEMAAQLSFQPSKQLFRA